MKKYYRLIFEDDETFQYYISSYLPMPPIYSGYIVIECSRIEYETNVINMKAFNLVKDLKYTHVVTYDTYFNLMMAILNGNI